MLIVSQIYACGTSKQIQPIVVSDVLMVKEAFIQEEIPGTQGEESKFYLDIQFDPIVDSKIKVDSIVFRSTTFEKATFDFSIDIKKQVYKSKLVTWVNHDYPPNHCTIYFKKEKKHFQQSVKSILVKEPIYLP